MNWLKENWFRAGILCAIILLAYSLFLISRERNGNVPNTTQNQNVSRITSDDIRPFLSGVQEIVCGNMQSGVTRGSGSLLSTKGGYYVLTNYHVIASGNCYFDPTDESGNSLGDFRFTYDTLTSASGKIRKANDIAILGLRVSTGSGWAGTQLMPSELNYGISKTRVCPSDISVGSPVAVLGYPAYAVEGVKTGWTSSRIMTEGSISGRTSDGDYYTDAKIDAGNSGGMAFSKDGKGLCLLGIPTALSVGEYETEGIVKNLHNALSLGN